MHNYIDLVVCKHKNNNIGFLFYAPAFSGLNESDIVIVDTKNGNKEAIVQCVITVELGSEEYSFIWRAANAYAPLRRVISKVVHEKMKYEG